MALSNRMAEWLSTGLAAALPNALCCTGEEDSRPKWCCSTTGWQVVCADQRRKFGRAEARHRLVERHDRPVCAGVAHTREEAQSTDGLEHDRPDVAAAPAGRGECETDDEEKRVLSLV